MSDVLTVPICAGWVVECRTRRGLMDKRNLRRCLKTWAKAKGDAFVAAVTAEAERLLAANPALRRPQSYKTRCSH